MNLDVLQLLSLFLFCCVIFYTILLQIAHLTPVPKILQYVVPDGRGDLAYLQVANFGWNQVLNPSKISSTQPSHVEVLNVYMMKDILPSHLTSKTL